MESKDEMEEHNEILSIEEIAVNLRCSRAHVYNAINGKLAGISKLPAISMGRRKIVRRVAFEAWKVSNDTLGQLLLASANGRPSEIRGPNFATVTGDGQ
jgi:predicted DNA-binding transcriptional regulator AlpA